jgi:hypothetical protein
MVLLPLLIGQVVTIQALVHRTDLLPGLCAWSSQALVRSIDSSSRVRA